MVFLKVSQLVSSKAGFELGFECSSYFLPRAVLGIDGEKERSTNTFLAIELNVYLWIENTLGTLREQ